MKYREKTVYLLLAGVCFSWACHDHGAMERQMADLRRDFEQIKIVQMNQSIQMEDLQNRLLLLSDEVDSTRLALRRRPQPQDERPSIVYGMDGTSFGTHAVADLPVLRLRPETLQEPEIHRPPSRNISEPLELMQLDEFGNIIRQGASTPPAPPAPVPPPRPTVSSGRNFDSRPVMLYRQGMDLLKAKQHAQAIMVFQDFLHQFPNHEYADNSLYWIGEAYYDQRQFDRALANFEDVVIRYPSGNKVPDALLKAAFCYRELGMRDRALALLEQLIKKYPGTNAAKLASRTRGDLL